MLMQPEKAALLVVDIQEKLVPAIHQGDQLAARASWLIQACQILNIPTLFTEQYPRGLGHTLPTLTSLVERPAVSTKVHFSAVAGGCLPREWQSRSQIIVCGMETHVCVLQTVLDLLQNGKNVFVVADVVGSRTEENRQLGLERMRNAGAQIVSREMVVFELMQQAGTDTFKTISKQFLVGDQP
ncbi:MULTISPECIES: hydrolase [Oceanimonas]|uniref:hydrolase n=1 Tax=Oceanimonas TaxID=129577 RepID=UPI00036EA2F8|nr:MULTISPECIES: hydrolase [Oceanimonas]MDV2857562.1 hydrolase [Oceanimonas sp. CAM02]